MDDKCTNALVLELVAAVDVATAACVNVKGFISLNLGQQIADVVAVSLDQPPGSDAINSHIPWL